MKLSRLGLGNYESINYTSAEDPCRGRVGKKVGK